MPLAFWARDSDRANGDYNLVLVTEYVSPGRSAGGARLAFRVIIIGLGFDRRRDTQIETQPEACPRRSPPGQAGGP
jgi:hypothetical protein